MIKFNFPNLLHNNSTQRRIEIEKIKLTRKRYQSAQLHTGTSAKYSAMLTYHIENVENNSMLKQVF